MASAVERRDAPPPRWLLRPLATALLLALALAALTPPAQARAAERARVCGVYRAPVLSSPDGFVVGYLFRPDPVRVLRRSADRHWARITTSHELRGWIRARYLCRR